MSAETIDLGDGHTLEFASYQGETRVGCSIKHKRPDGTDCSGWLAFKGRAWSNSFLPVEITAWSVEFDDPITLSPSVLCRACGDHGFVRGGKWVRA